MKSFISLSLLALAITSIASPLPKNGDSSKSSTSTKGYSATGNVTLNLRTPRITSVPRRFNQTPPLQGNPSRNGTNTTLAMPGLPAGGDLPMKPKYRVVSNFDRQSLTLGLNQELIELDLFRDAFKKFSVEEWEAAGINANDRYLIEFMGQQEVGHATAFTNMLGPDVASKQCVYQYHYTTPKEFILFSQLITRFGESGTLGFLPHMDNRASAQIILQAITTESRQEMIFRQFQGLFPMPVWFEVGVPQAFQWTLLSRYIKSCPSNNTRILFDLFPDLVIENQPNLLNFTPAITQNTSGETGPGREVLFHFDSPGKTTGWNNSYVTATRAGKPKFAAWVNQLNVTYTALYDIDYNNNRAATVQPKGLVFPGSGDLPGNAIVNQTMFIVLTDSNPFLTPYNITLINSHVVAGPALYQSG